MGKRYTLQYKGYKSQRKFNGKKYDLIGFSDTRKEADSFRNRIKRKQVSRGRPVNTRLVKSKKGYGFYTRPKK